MSHCSSVAQQDSDLTMFINCKLPTLTLVLTLCGQVHSGGIIGGHEAKPHSRPYMALLELKVPDKPDGHCGGFLLNEDFVMTAAHCQAESYKVFLGLHSYFDVNGIQELPVGKTFPHKDYDGKHYKNDIMLLQLSSKAKFNEHVKPIALAAEDNGHLPKLCSVSGWGKINDEHVSLKLLELNVTLTNNSHCAGEKLYCSEGPTGPGKGDSGGPLVCEDGKAYGLVSCSKKPDPDGSMVYRYTKIPEYKQWLDNIMKPKGKF
ncbi:granzyme B(G,H)-like [Acanthochromis polyacanthus]|uniref:granzyme B(G,H)-like n=1 Tax=Acanthochromis polyacanthus TaxID=80966 RepID=UPI0022341FE3|nr:granzyme B(G,H)-like [Acanthochromis polyacanthus]